MLYAEYWYATIPCPPQYIRPWVPSNCPTAAQQYNDALPFMQARGEWSGQLHPQQPLCRSLGERGASERPIHDMTHTQVHRLAGFARRTSVLDSIEVKVTTLSGGMGERSPGLLALHASPPNDYPFDGICLSCLGEWPGSGHIGMLHQPLFMSSSLPEETKALCRLFLDR